jgi:putative ABC transport system permease protein
MDVLWQDIRFAVRGMFKNPISTAIAVLSLALGIGANTTIFTLLNAVFLAPLPVRQPSELMAVYTVDENSTGGFGGALGVSHPNFRDYRDQNQVFTGMAAYTFPLPVSLAVESDPQQAFAELVTGNYFDVLGVRALAGRTFLPDEDITPDARPVAVVSYAFCQRRLGGTSIVGRTIHINGTVYTVVGVTPDGFKGVNSLFSPDLWLPSMMHRQVLPVPFKTLFDERRALIFNVIGRAKPGVTLPQAQDHLKTIARALEQEYPAPNKGRSVTLKPITEATIFPALRGALFLGGAVLMTVVGLVLLIACSNVANLLLARAAARRQEIATRVALGASRRRLVRQLLTESVILAIVSALIGLAVASVARTAIASMRPPFLSQNFVEFTLDGRVLLFTAIVALGTGLVFGLVPALQASKTDVVSALKEEMRTAGPSRRRLALGNTLVVAQVALSLVALVAAGLFLRSLQKAHSIDPGFETRRLAVVTVNPGQAGYNRARTRQFYELMAQRAAAIPGVERVAWAGNVPLFGGFQRTVVVEGTDPSLQASRNFATTITISPDYFATTGIRLLSGRDFTVADREGSVPVAIINETMAARLWPNQNAIGRRFQFYTDKFMREVVGVVRTTKYVTLGEEPQLAAYIPLEQEFSDFMVLFTRTSGEPAPVLGTVQGELRALDSLVPATNPFTIGQVIDTSLWAARLAAVLLGVLGGLALVLASIGLYGLLAYSVTQRQQEIGLRMALGAAQSVVLRAILRQAMTLVGVGLLVGLAVAVLVSRVVARLLFGISATDPTTFTLVSLILIGVGLVASLVPAWRASRVDPIVALRSA